MINEVYNEGYKYCQDMRIPCYDTDAAFCLKPASFMDMAQEIAYWAAQALGFGYDDLQKHRTAWVLSRMHFHYEAFPKWRDAVVLKTWHKGADGLFFLRDFHLLTPGGESLVRATSSWLVMDMETRRLVRGGDVLQLVDADTRVEEDAIAEPAPKIVIPKDLPLEEKGRRTVSYSDVDIIGHTNNARYIVWAFDCLDYDLVSGRRVRDVYINFNKETRPGETVQLMVAAAEEDGSPVRYVEGLSDGKSAFVAKIVF